MDIISTVLLHNIHNKSNENPLIFSDFQICDNQFAGHGALYCDPFEIFLLQKHQRDLRS